MAEIIERLNSSTRQQPAVSVRCQTIASFDDVDVMEMYYVTFRSIASLDELAQMYNTRVATLENNLLKSPVTHMLCPLRCKMYIFRHVFLGGLTDEAATRIGALLNAHIPVIIPDDMDLKRLNSVIIKYCEHAFDALTTIPDVFLLYNQILHYYKSSDWRQERLVHGLFNQRVQKTLKGTQSLEELKTIEYLIPARHQTDLTLSWRVLVQCRFTISADNLTIQEIYAAIGAAEAITLDDWDGDNFSQYNELYAAISDLIEDANLMQIELLWAVV